MQILQAHIGQDQPVDESVATPQYEHSIRQLLQSSRPNLQQRARASILAWSQISDKDSLQAFDAAVLHAGLAILCLALMLPCPFDHQSYAIVIHHVSCWLCAERLAAFLQTRLLTVLKSVSVHDISSNVQQHFDTAMSSSVGWSASKVSLVCRTTCNNKGSDSLDESA